MPELESPPKRVVVMLVEVKGVPPLEELEALPGLENSLSVMPVEDLAPEDAERDGDKILSDSRLSDSSSPSSVSMEG